MNESAPAPQPTDSSALDLPIPKRGDEIELTIEDWGDKGLGIAHHGRMVVLTDRGLPGDRVRARVWKRRRRHLQADVLEILEPSPHRIDAPCKHFGTCGGCRLQDLEYAHQLDDKVRHLREQLKRIGGIDPLPDVEIVPCDPPSRYRNKMEFSFGGGPGAELMLGLHPRNNYRRVFNLEECWLIDERAAQIANSIRQFFAEGDEEPYDPVAHTGFLRFVVVRIGHYTGDVLINLVTADHPWPRAEEFGAWLQAQCPFVTTALWTVNGTRANVATGDVQTVYFGPGILKDRLGPFEFEIAPTGFFQTNTRQAERLFSIVIDWVAPSGEEDVLDLYCGAGSISLFLSQRARSVVGVELHEESVEAARRNAIHNGITNCEFHAGDALVFLRERAEAGALPSIVVDPPRAGLHPKAVKALCAVGPAKLVYVSCNPGALARDLDVMRSVYRVDRLAAVDMFPHTPHIEAVALLTRDEIASLRSQ